MRVIDFHCDTILKLMDDEEKVGLRRNDFSVDIEKMNKGSVLAQFFALFVLLDKKYDPFARCMDMLKKFKVEIKKNEDVIAHALNYNDVMENDARGTISAFLTIEEGGVLKGNLDNLKLFYEEGVRLITLTWNFPNEIGYPNFKFIDCQKGLTAFGKELVEAMSSLRMLPDVSHLSDAGFYDVAARCKGPFVASHSNAREITMHSRNLTDEMIKLLASRGGIMGLNFCAAFLGNSECAKIEDMVAHVKHIYKVGGTDVISLGSDFDGIGNEVEIKDISEMDKLAHELAKAGFSEGQIEKIFFGNALRVIREAL